MVGDSRTYKYKTEMVGGVWLRKVGRYAHDWLFKFHGWKRDVTIRPLSHFTIGP